MYCTSPSSPLLEGANGLPIPSWGFITKTVQYFYLRFFASSCCWSDSRDWFLEKIQNHCYSREQPIYAAEPSLPNFSKHAAGPPAPPGATPPPPTPLARESQVDSFQSNSQGNWLCSGTITLSHFISGGHHTSSDIVTIPKEMYKTHA